MRCPSCHRPVDHEANSCYSCEYSLADAEKKFGANQVSMRRIHDAADCLRVREIREVEDTLDDLEDRFPQLMFAAYLGELNDSISVAELGFWLLNHARIGDSGYSRPNDCGILFVLDVERRQLGVSLGYLTEMLLSEEDCLRALTASRSHFINGEFGAGVISFFRKVEKCLLKQAKKMKGLSREEKQILMMKNHHGPNTLVLPAPVMPMQFDANEEQIREHNEPFEHLIFRNEFESERE